MKSNSSFKIKNLSVDLGKKQILKDITLEVQVGKLHALMGPNGSGKSTLGQTLMGNPNYEIKNKNANIKIDGKNLTNLKSDDRARLGLFLAFQNPISIPGVNVANLLKTAVNLIKKKSKQQNVWEFNKLLVSKAKLLGIKQEFLSRSLNEEFSGGEKKKLEMLQAVVICPKFAIFDEIDTGLDIDALKVVARGLSQMKKQGTGILLITHYQRILRFVKPDFVHILVDGRIVESDGYKLAQTVEKNGYKKWVKIIRE